jgi:hypothetical protein
MNGRFEFISIEVMAMNQKFSFIAVGFDQRIKTYAKHGL